MENLYILVAIVFALIILIFLMRNFKWIIQQIRNICKNESGYIKLVQLIFVSTMFSAFMILLIYTIINDQPTTTSNIMITIVVGLMGTIIGTFFSEKTMESIKKDRDKKNKIIKEKTKSFEKSEKRAIGLISEFDKLMNTQFSELINVKK